MPTAQWSPARLAVPLLLTGLASVWGVDHSKFRTCSQTNFCRSHRTATAETSRPYVIAPNSLELSGDGRLTAQLHGGPLGKALTLELHAYDTGVARMRVRETNPLHGARWEPDDILTPHPLRALRRLDPRSATVPAELRDSLTAMDAEAYATRPDDSAFVVVYKHPFRASLYEGKAGEEASLAAQLNGHGKFYFEAHRPKEGDGERAPLPSAGDDVHAGKTVVDYGEDGLAIYSDGTKQERGVEAAAAAEGDAHEETGLWEENFGAHEDTKPFGPASVGMDVTFDGAEFVYGLAEHTGPLNLASTTGEGAHFKEPYRMWTLDVYDYELDSPMALYGGVPLMLAHTARRTTGVLWFNPTETFVDVWREGGAPGGIFTKGTPAKATSAYWMSESGIVDVFLLPGPSPAHIFSQYAELTGYTPLPPLFSLGYHQCRWNYNDEADVRYVHGQFEALDMPYDVLWLDIEHTDGKRYFTWDSYKFPKPKEMQEELASTGRKMVTIVDPHIKIDSNYAVYQEAHEKKLFINDRHGAEFDGWCWPGSSAYIDFTSAEARDWWAGRFAYDKYEGSTPDLYTWNDMNEPSVFNGPEVSMSKDAKSLAGIEHREWHNLYGMYMARATSEGLLKRNPKQDRRPFVLSRAFYAGSQRWGAIWTGDNACRWDHLVASIPMLLALGICGITFSGADVGGFLGKGGGYGDPDAELFTRWFAVGAYTPFFRGHAHHDSARREPWTFGEAATAQLRSIALERYQLLAYWYTLFHVASKTGMPTMAPMWVHFPSDARTFGAEDAWMVGAALLVHPVVTQGATTVRVYFPGDGVWYGVRDGESYRGGDEREIAAPLPTIPVFQAGGTIVPRQMRLRRSSAQMGHDPYTLVVAADADGVAEGQLYLDAGDGFDHEQGGYALRSYRLEAGVLASRALHSSDLYAPTNTLERVELLGVSTPSRVTLEHAGAATIELDFSRDEGRRCLVLRKPAVPMAADWKIVLHP